MELKDGRGRGQSLKAADSSQLEGGGEGRMGEREGRGWGEKGLREEWRILFVYYTHMFYVL